MTEGLADSLRQGTRTLHTEVEGSHFMRALLRGQMARAPYCLLLRNLHALYTALEATLSANTGTAQVAAICMPALFRTGSLERDLDFLHGPAWRSQLGITSACQDYLHHLQHLSVAHPERLVAHAYVRYLGDLSGGQQLKGIVARSLQLPAGRGVDFYDFGDSPQTAALTQAFRAGLAGIRADSLQIGQIVAEAQHAFVRHGVLFRELALASGLGGKEHPATGFPGESGGGTGVDGGADAARHSQLRRPS